MAQVLVTGAAGFVGSHLSEQLLAAGHTVVGVDAFIPYYPRAIKERNLATALANPAYTFHELDLRRAELAPVLDGVEIVFHTAAMAGLLKSWQQFEEYMSCNILATQRLLDAAVAANVGHFLHCSTSSVYGRFATGDERAPLAPISPYGITKLAAEELCRAYGEKDGLRFTILRLFSVYGPRQRPDMGYNIFIRKLLAGETITVDGDGTDSRSNTYVADCVRGLMLAAEQPEKSVGQVFNLGGGEEVNVNEVLAMLEELSGQKARIEHGPQRPGDQRRTVADIGKARSLLGYDPQTRIVDGLAAQLAWQRSIMG
ncbi:MAG TPA: NAD-dependent epimerase/dehydratase family protein [Caldilinea sp.]|nr:NAD-dependent epimerase/dehydratase family protein [Caldilinea sp.]